jgi:hypothetical protein
MSGTVRRRTDRHISQQSHQLPRGNSGSHAGEPGLATQDPLCPLPDPATAWPRCSRPATPTRIIVGAARDPWPHVRPRGQPGRGKRSAAGVAQLRVDRWPTPTPGATPGTSSPLRTTPELIRKPVGPRDELLQTSGGRRSVGSPPWAMAAGGGRCGLRCSAHLLVATARGIGDPPPRSEVPQAVRRNHLRPQPFAASRESATTQAIGRLLRRCAERTPVSASPAVHQLWLANDHRP